MAAVNNNKPVNKPAPQPAAKPNEADKSKAPPANKSKAPPEAKAKPADKAQPADKAKGAEKTNGTPDAGKTKEAKPAEQKPKDQFDSKNGAHIQAQQKKQQEKQVQQTQDAKMHAATSSSEQGNVPELAGGPNAQGGSVQAQSIPSETSAASGASGNTAPSTKVTGKGPNDSPYAPGEHRSVNNLAGGGDQKLRDTNKDQNAGNNTRDNVSTVEKNAQGQTVPKGEKTSAEALLKGNGGERYKDTYPSTSQNPKDSAQFGKDQERVFKAAKDQGASDSEAAILTAQLAQEGELDKAKSQSGAATNYGPFNLNQDLLKNYGGGKENPKENSGLTDAQLQQKFNPGADGKYSDEALKNNVTAARNAMSNLGADNYLHHVRGGDTGFSNPDQKATQKSSQYFDDGNGQGRTVNIESDDNYRFTRTVANSAMDILNAQQQGKLGQPVRYAGDIPNI